MGKMPAQFGLYRKSNCLYLRMIEAMSPTIGEKPEDWQRLRELCHDLVALRRSDHNAERRYW